MVDEKRRHRRETRLLQNESSWLQKALFALRKVEDVQDRLADLHDEDPPAYALEIDGRDVPLDAIQDALEARSSELTRRVRERRRI